MCQTIEGKKCNNLKGQKVIFRTSKYWILIHFPLVHPYSVEYSLALTSPLIVVCLELPDV